MKPKILIPLSTHPHFGPRMFANVAYTNVLENSGALPLFIARPSDQADLDQLLSVIDGIFLMGGSDVDPAQYDRSHCKHIQVPDRERDEIELLLLGLAEQRQLPVLGICRGMQMMNTALGGTLYRDIEDERPESLTHDLHNKNDRSYIAHEVTISSGSMLSSIIGVSSTEVNSLHHQGIQTLGRELVAAATAPDGLVEAIEHPKRKFWIGVQWHPEELMDAPSQKLITAFVKACRQ